MKVSILLLIAALLVNDDHTIELRLKPGDQFKYTLKYYYEIIPPPGDPTGVRLNEEYEYLIKVDKENKSGFTVSATCNWKSNIVSFGDYSMESDSRNGKSNPFFQVLDSNKTIEMHMLRNGKVTDLKKAKFIFKDKERETQIGFNNFIDAVSGAYPGKPVRVGEVWRDSIPSSLGEEYFLNKYKLEKIEKGYIYITLQGIKVTDGFKRMDISSENELWGPGKFRSSDNGVQKGTLVFNYKNGGLVKADIVREGISNMGYDPIERRENKPLDQAYQNYTRIQIQLMEW